MISQVYRAVRLGVVAASLVFSAPVFAAEHEQDKVYYFLGTVVYDNLSVLNLSDDEMAEVIRGIREGRDGSAEPLDPTVYGPRLQALRQEKAAEAAQQEAVLGVEYTAKMAKEDGAVTLDSGVVYRELEAGDGAQPVATSVVKAHYKGTLRDGTVFDSSIARGEPLTIGLNQVVPCWTNGIVMMKVGGKAKLTCPAETAYGARGSGAIPPNSALTFEVELIEIVETPAGS